MATKRKSQAKLKNLTKERFCELFCELPTKEKFLVIENLKESLATGLTPHDKIKVREQDIPALKQLIGWAQMNLLVGRELCPPENLSNY